MQKLGCATAPSVAPRHLPQRVRIPFVATVSFPHPARGAPGRPAPHVERVNASSPTLPPQSREGVTRMVRRGLCSP